MAKVVAFSPSVVGASGHRLVHVVTTIASLKRGLPSHAV